MTTRWPDGEQQARDGEVLASGLLSEPGQRRPILMADGGGGEEADAHAHAHAGTTRSGDRRASALNSTRSAPPPPDYTSTLSQQPRPTHSTAASAASASESASSVTRTPNPAKRAGASAALDDLRSAVTRDALRGQARSKTTHTQPSAQRNVAVPVASSAGPGAAAVSTAASVSPPASPTMSSTPKPSTSSARRDPQTIMPRNPSIDSAVSSLSGSHSTSQKPNAAHAYKVQEQSTAPEDIAALIAAAGSPEVAIQKILNEKNQAASHNAQLWRLVEKQRAMILGLNKDLEKSLKEKDRYRRKLKDHLAQSESAPSLTTANQQLEELVAREDSQSPAVKEDSSAAVSMRDFSIDDRKASDDSGAPSFGPNRSDTPQDVSITPSSNLAADPQTTYTAQQAARDVEPKDVAASAPIRERKVPEPINVQRLPPQIQPLASPRVQDLQLKTPTNSNLGHHKNNSVSSAASPPPSAASFSSPKSLTSRKGAAPAPLNLASPKKEIAPADVTNNIMDASDSEYEDDPASARGEHMERGRRKTREDDDREREVVARQEAEHRSQSSKSKKSKSKQPPEHPGVPQVEYVPVEPPRPQQPVYSENIDPASIVRQRAIVEGLQKSHTAPSLLSPGLPMSPRPGDRPMNSPLPRAPNKVMNGMPMSPKAGMAGLPLSPRAPRQPIPMPPQTPLAFASPHLARAGEYQQQMQHQTSSLANQVMSSPEDTPYTERPSTSSSVPMTPGEIYRGYVTDQYPDLLLPPNALPSIFVKTASSRMRPSRNSYIQPKAVDENPVFTLAVHARSDHKQLWRVEKTFAALAQLDEQIRAVWNIRERLPDKALFAGHAPAKIDARRSALDSYFNRMLESVTEEKAAMVVCRYLSTDAIGATESGDYFGVTGPKNDSRPDTPVKNARPRREGYLTKRGKNFGGWKARYFILDGPVFKYFDNRGGAQLGSIKLQNAQIGKQSNHGQNPQEDEDNQFRHAFLILEPKKKDSTSLVRHVLCAESDEERDVWVDALLQYVDYRESEDEAAAARAAHSLKPSQDTSGGRSPRFKSSFQDLRPSSRVRGDSETKDEGLRAVGYNDTVAGDAPVMVPGPNARKGDTPSPPHDGNFGPAVDHSSTHPNISGPTNLQVISNSTDWGMKPPPTPSHQKKEKRGLFGFRGRSSSDLDVKNTIGSPGLPPQDHYATGGPRAVFGVPLAEAVEFARPADVATNLPAVVYRCIEYLLAMNAVAEEGIFRLSGSNTVIKALKDRFNVEGDVNLLAEGAYHDIHAVASLLKLYLRELPASILTRDLHLEFLQCLERHGKEKVAALNVLVNQLPRPNRALLEALSSFLLSIVSNAEINKMNVRNGKSLLTYLRLPNTLISS